MAEYVPRYWRPIFGAPSLRERRGGRYETYLPDPLVGWSPEFSAELVSDLYEAESAIRQLDASGIRHVGLDCLARFLLRAEAVASSRIEGLAVGPRRLLQAEAILAEGGDPGDRMAAEILGNIRAMDAAIESGASRPAVTLGDLFRVHRLIMDSSSTPELGGKIRAEQNWLGGNAYNPVGAPYVPPPPEYVAPLMDDLIAYLNQSDHSPLVQAGVAHAQFETIHPFADGNGRTGRALIHTVLRRRGLAHRLTPPVSLALAARSAEYIDGLTAFRHESPPDSPSRSEAVRPWLRTLARATRDTCEIARRYAADIGDLAEGWRRGLGRIRRHSSTERLLAVLPSAPVVTVESASRMIGRSTVSTGGAVNRFLEAGILVQRNVGKKRYRIFESPDVIDLLADLEQSLTVGAM